ncbi:MAG: diguanylate cyclase, partial [Clostridiales bacterium]|nr:diguanylate cyclase [Clostridiales bacterium]
LPIFYGNQFFVRGCGQQHELYSYIQYDTESKSYTLDALKGTKFEKKAGNLTGTGSLPKEDMVVDEINLALYYTEFFISMDETMTDIERLYYTSNNEFIYLYPWINSKDFEYAREIKNLPFYTAALPQNNPRREKVWTPVYADDKGRGLIVSLSKPVYYEDTFLGVVSFDLSPRTLGQMLECPYDGFLLENTNAVITANRKVLSEKEVFEIEELIRFSNNDIVELETMENGAVKRVGFNYVYQYYFDDAPWKMMLIMPVSEIFLKSFATTIPFLIITYLLFLAVREIGIRRRAEDRLNELAITDELTGLKNRYYLGTVIDGEFERSDRYSQPLSMMMLDIDHFKKINDAWGHPIGDEVLQKTASIVKSLIRRADILIRLGGEEFLVVLPHTDFNGAMEAAEKIRKAIAAADHTVAGKWTASFGIAERRYSETYDEIYRRVDEALYLAKTNGRNQVVSYELGSKKPMTGEYLEWKDSWNSGNEEIDRQHKSLLELSNKLMFMSLTDIGTDKMNNQVAELIEHIRIHFKYEEALLEQIAYENYEKHTKVHEELVARAIRLEAAFYKGDLKASAFFNFMVNDIILGHFLQENTIVHLIFICVFSNSVFYSFVN